MKKQKKSTGGVQKSTGGVQSLRGRNARTNIVVSKDVQDTNIQNSTQVEVLSSLKWYYVL